MPLFIFTHSFVTSSPKKTYLHSCLIRVGESKNSTTNIGFPSQPRFTYLQMPWPSLPQLQSPRPSLPHQQSLQPSLPPSSTVTAALPPSSTVTVALPSADASKPSPAPVPVVPVVPVIPSPQKQRHLPLLAHLASPGPGPKTMVAAVANWSFTSAAHLGVILKPLEEDDMDVEVVLDPKGKGKQKETKRKRVDEEEEWDESLPWPKKRRDAVIEVVEDSVPRTKKRKERTNDQVIEVVEDTMPWTKKSKPQKEKLVIAAKIDKHMESERETVKEIVERLLRQKERQVVKPISTSGSEFKESSSEEEVDSCPRPPIRSDIILICGPQSLISPLPPKSINCYPF